MKRQANKPLRALLIGVAGLAALLASGCTSVHTVNSKHDTTFGKKEKVQNVYQTKLLPEHLRRIAMLPLDKGRYDHLEMEGIEENFTEELIKRNLFEVVTVTPEDMIDLFGKRSFSSVEYLPTQLLARLYKAYGVDGVMFVDVTYFNAYQPVGLGIRAKLLDGHTGELAWSTDELFDSSSPAVSNAARKYFKTQSVNPYPLQDTQTVLHSPTRFSKYVAAAVFDTIQAQDKPSKNL